MNKQAKAEKIKELQRFLKKQVIWKPHEPYNFSRVYEGEPIMVLGSRNEKNPKVMESAIFVNTMEEADAVLKWNPDYYQAVFSMDGFDLLKENTRPFAPDLSDFIRSLEK